jgi:hypothetical protein
MVKTLLPSSALLFCVPLACSSAPEPTQAQQTKGEATQVDATAPRIDPPPPVQPERLPSPTDWQPLSVSGEVTALGRLPRYGAFVGVQRRDEQARWVLALGFDGSPRVTELGPGEIHGIAETSTGELVIGGVNGAGSLEELWFARLDPEGKLVSQGPVTTELALERWRGVFSRGDHAILLGSFGTMDPEVEYGRALIVDSKGIVEDLRPGGRGSHELSSAVVLPDGGLMVFGAAWRGDDKSPWAVRIGADNKVGNEMVHAGSPWGDTTTAALGVDGAIYAAGTSADSKPMSLRYIRGKLEVLKMDTQGKVEWAHRWHDDIALVGSMVPLPKAGVVLLAATIDEGQDRETRRGRELFLVSIPPDGSEPKFTAIETPSALLSRGVFSAAILGVRDAEAVLLQLEITDDPGDDPLADPSYRWRFATYPL